MRKIILSFLSLCLFVGLVSPSNNYYVWDGRYEYIERYVHKRWGANGKCLHCKRRFAIGGEKKKYRVRRQIKDYKNMCDGPWEVLWSYHAAEINHTFVEQTTADTHTGDNSWTDISGASISDTFFTTSKKYWVVCKSRYGGNDINDIFGMKVLHGTTEFLTSAEQEEPSGTAVNRPYFWFRVWIAVASEGIKMQFITRDSANTVKADQLTLFAMNLSDDLAENTDWYSNEVVANTSLSTSWSSSNNASITFTPSGSSRWLIKTTSRIDVGATNTRYMSRINSSGDVTDTEPTCATEGEDSTFDIFVYTLLRAFALTNQSNTFKEESRATASNGIRRSSYVFALNLNKFKDMNTIYTAAEEALSASTWGTEVQTLSITPSQTGDVLILSHYIYDCNSQNLHATRVQVDGSDQPPGEGSVLYPWIDYDATEEAIIADMTVENLDNTAHTIDIDAYVDSTTNTPAAEDRSVVLVTMELLAAGQTVVINQVTETDLAQPIGKLKEKSISQVTETDLAQPVGRDKSKTLGQVSESDISQPITWDPKNRLVNQASELDVAQPVNWDPKIRLINQTTESDIAQPITAPIVVLINQASEVDVAQGITWDPKNRLINPASENDLAQPISWDPKNRLVAQVSEIDLAQPITAPIVVLINQVTEIDLAQPISWDPKNRLIAQVSELDSAQNILWSPKNRLLNIVSEIDLAQPISIPIIKLLNQVTEIDLAQPVTWDPKTRLIGIAVETDLAQPITVVMFIPLFKDTFELLHIASEIFELFHKSDDTFEIGGDTGETFEVKSG